MSARSSLDLDALHEAALAAALAGGTIARDAFGNVNGIRAKGPGDWVTHTDTASERAVRAVLLEAAPEIPVHGEEEGGDRGALGWLVDPVDGTANFLHQFPAHPILVAKAVGEEAVVFLGDVTANAHGIQSVQSGFLAALAPAVTQNAVVAEDEHIRDELLVSGIVLGAAAGQKGKMLRIEQSRQIVLHVE